MPNELLDRYRAKYPKYRDVDDATLAKGIVEKFPVYADKLQDVLAPPQHTFGSEQIKTKEAPDPILDARVAATEAANEATGQFQKGLGQMFGANQPFDLGRSLAGLANVGVGALKTPGPAIAGARELLRPGILDEGGLGLITAAEDYVLKPAGEFVGNVFAEGSSDVATRLGASQETAQAISEPMRDIGSMAGQGAVVSMVAGMPRYNAPFRNTARAQGLWSGLNRPTSVPAGGGGGAVGSLRPSKLGATFERGFETMGMRALQAGEDMATRQTATRRALSDPAYQISPGGSAVAQSRAHTLQGEKMMGLVEPATQRGDLYSVQPIRNKFKGLIDEFEKSGGRNSADVLAVKKVASKFEDIVSKEGFEGEYLSPQRLEIFKEDLNKLLRKDFKAMKRGQPSELAPIKKQALLEEVSGAKGILEERLPGIKELNKAQSTEIVIQDAIDDVLFRMSGGMRSPQGMLASLRGDPAGLAALGISEKIFKPNVRFDIAGKGYRAGRWMQGKPTGVPTIPPYSKIPLYNPVPTARQLHSPAIPLGAGYKDTFTIRTGPISAVPDVSLSKPKQLTAGTKQIPERAASYKGTEWPGGDLRLTKGQWPIPKDLVWDAKQQAYVIKSTRTKLKQ